MNFDFSDEQKHLKDEARRFLADRCPPSVVRRVLDGEEPHDQALWSAVAEMGWLGAAVPEAFGGLGLGHLELCVLAEELGRALAPLPFSSSVYLATEALLLAGSEAQKQSLLPRLVAGEIIGTFAVAEGVGAPRPQNLRASVSGGRLSGRKIPVPDGASADVAVVLARGAGEEGAQAFSLFLVDLGDASVARRPVETVDPSRSFAEIEFRDTPAEPLGPRGQGFEVMRQVFDRAAVLLAFEQVGGAQACLEMARDYTLGRYAFGRPIASFQAVKHRLADMYVGIELARSNAYYGAWALSKDAAELPIAAAGARVSAIDAYHFASKENIQLHGGMGYTWEFDCHLHYRRAKLLALMLGARRQWSDRLITQIERRNVAEVA